jgi:hypothetical protein
LTRGAAALALAKTGEKKALGALMSAVVQGGVGADAATMALVEHPPSSLNVLLEGRRRIDPAIANLLAVMGDMRAQDRLRLALAETARGCHADSARTNVGEDGGSAATSCGRGGAREVGNGRRG